MYSHKSGSQKRKERAAREQKLFEGQKRQRTLAAFNFCQNARESCSTSESDKNVPTGQQKEPQNPDLQETVNQDS